MSQIIRFQEWAEQLTAIPVEQWERFNAEIQREIEQSAGEPQRELARLKLRLNTRLDRMRRAKE